MCVSANFLSRDINSWFKLEQDESKSKISFLAPRSIECSYLGVHFVDNAIIIFSVQGGNQLFELKSDGSGGHEDESNIKNQRHGVSTQEFDVIS